MHHQKEYLQKHLSLQIYTEVVKRNEWMIIKISVLWLKKNQTNEVK